MHATSAPVHALCMPFACPGRALYMPYACPVHALCMPCACPGRALYMPYVCFACPALAPTMPQTCLVIPYVCPEHAMCLLHGVHQLLVYNVLYHSFAYFLFPH